MLTAAPRLGLACRFRGRSTHQFGEVLKLESDCKGRTVANIGAQADGVCSGSPHDRRQPSCTRRKPHFWMPEGQHDSRILASAGCSNRGLSLLIHACKAANPLTEAQANLTTRLLWRCLHESPGLCIRSRNPSSGACMNHLLVIGGGSDSFQSNHGAWRRWAG